MNEPRKMWLTTLVIEPDFTIPGKSYDRWEDAMALARSRANRFGLRTVIKKER